MAELAQIYTKAKNIAFNLFPAEVDPNPGRAANYGSYKDLEEVGRWDEELFVPLEERHPLDKQEWKKKLQEAGEVIGSIGEEDFGWCHEWYVYKKNIPNCYFLLSASRKTIVIEDLATHRGLANCDIATNLHISDVLYCVWVEVCKRSALPHMVGELQKIVHLVVQNSQTLAIMDTVLKDTKDNDRTLSITQDRSDVMALHGSPNGAIGLYMLRDHLDLKHLFPSNIKYYAEMGTLVFKYARAEIE